MKRGQAVRILGNDDKPMDAIYVRLSYQKFHKVHEVKIRKVIAGMERTITWYVNESRFVTPLTPATR